MVASYLGGPIHYREGVEEFPACHGGQFLFLRNGQVTEITSIEIDGVLVDPSNYRLDSAGYGRIVARNGFRFPFTGSGSGGVDSTPYQAAADGRIRVVFNAGWVTPGQAAIAPNPPRTLPMDIEQAAIELITTLYRAKGADSRIASYSLGDSSVSYTTDAGGAIGSRVKNILAPYRNISRRTY